MNAKAWFTAIMLGVAGGLLFWPMADAMFDGRARSLILPQLAALLLVGGLSWWLGDGWPRRWMAPAVTVAVFYAAWALGYVAINWIAPGMD